MSVNAVFHIYHPLCNMTICYTRGSPPLPCVKGYLIPLYMSSSPLSGFSLTPYLESFTPTFGLGTPVFPRISSNLHSGTPTFSKRCLWDSYFQNPSENPVCYLYLCGISHVWSVCTHRHMLCTICQLLVVLYFTCYLIYD